MYNKNDQEQFNRFTEGHFVDCRKEIFLAVALFTKNIRFIKVTKGVSLRCSTITHHHPLIVDFVSLFLGADRLGITVYNVIIDIEIH